MYLTIVQSCPASFKKVFGVAKKDASSLDKKITILEKEAYERSTDATNTKERAEEMLAKIKDFMKDLEGRCIL